MRCKIDDGTLDHLEQSGYVDIWKCRRCKVIWEMKPEADFDTDREVVLGLIKKKLVEYDIGRSLNGTAD